MTGEQSAAQRFKALPAKERNAILASLSDKETQALVYDWSFWSRPAQRAPAWDWRHWLIQAGRGFGKTRCGAEWVRQAAVNNPGCRIALVNDTAADVRDVMIEGPSGIVSVCPPWDRPNYTPSNRRVTWANGSVAIAYSAEAPELLRGPEHSFAWADEPAKWQNLRKADKQGGTAWDNLMFGLRIGKAPQVVATTTPRPVKLIKELRIDPRTHVTRGATFDNADNLARPFIDDILKKYDGTRLGRQEINGELLDDNPGALWSLENIDANRIQAAPNLKRIVVAIDPAATSGEDSDETGIVVAGIDNSGSHGYILDDVTCKLSPHGWATCAVEAYRKHRADRIIGETNNGGEMVEFTVRTVDRSVPFKAVHASRGKQTRAEPIAALYEQNRVHHVGSFAALEDQMCEWEPGQKSPDRMDALVWALTELFYGENAAPPVFI